MRTEKTAYEIISGYELVEEGTFDRIKSTALGFVVGKFFSRLIVAAGMMALPGAAPVLIALGIGTEVAFDRFTKKALPPLSVDLGDDLRVITLRRDQYIKMLDGLDEKKTDRIMKRIQNLTEKQKKIGDKLQSIAKSDKALGLISDSDYRKYIGVLKIISDGELTILPINHLRKVESLNRSNFDKKK